MASFKNDFLCILMVDMVSHRCQKFWQFYIEGLYIFFVWQKIKLKLKRERGIAARGEIFPRARPSCSRAWIPPSPSPINACHAGHNVLIKKRSSFAWIFACIFVLRRVLHWGDACFPFSNGFKVNHRIVTQLEKVTSSLSTIWPLPKTMLFNECRYIGSI